MLFGHTDLQRYSVRAVEGNRAGMGFLARQGEAPASPSFTLFQLNKNLKFVNFKKLLYVLEILQFLRKSSYALRTLNKDENSLF